VPGLILAQATSDNVPGGAILTFAFPIILFAIIATTLYFLLFARPHPRVPARRVSLAAATGTPAPAATHGAAVAAGMPTASGGGSAESAAEPHGAKRDALTGDDGDTGIVAGTTEGSTEQGTTEGTEGSE
jgi:hypothetical protein